MSVGEIYLDNAATTCAYEEVVALMSEILTSSYGNPSSLHKKGMTAEQLLKTAREQVAAPLKCKPGEILFTSGGTESDNLALFGVARAYARQGRHIITSAIEHPAVKEACARLSQEGFEITTLPTDEKGFVRVPDVADALRPDTILVSVLPVNNEIGSVQPVQEIGALLKKTNSAALLHTDAVQGYGKVPLVPSSSHVDLMSISGHKIHAPKGTGALYVRKGVRLQPLFYGGGQQGAMRPGTENVPGYCALGLAAELIHARREKNVRRMASLKQQLMQGLSTALDGISFYSGELSDAASFAPHILSVGVDGVRAEVLLHALEDFGICVSSGSACSSNHPQPSDVLRSIGLRDPALYSVIRMSFSEFTTPEQIDLTIRAMCELVPALRRFQRV